MKQKETLLNTQVNKMKRKNILIIIGLLTGILLVAILSFINLSQKKKAKVSNKLEYKLEKEVSFISSSSGNFLSSLWVEIAETPYEQSKGLMYRNYMPDSVGMLFIYPGSEERSYWMQNTRISLDIIYVNDKMEIVSAYEFTIPYSEEGLPSHEVCKYVIETNAGYMQEYGIAIGDRIIIKN